MPAHVALFFCLVSTLFCNIGKCEAEQEAAVNKPNLSIHRTVKELAPALNPTLRAESEVKQSCIFEMREFSSTHRVIWGY